MQIESNKVNVDYANWYSAEEFKECDFSYEVSSPIFRVSFDGDFSKGDRYRYNLMCDYNSDTKEWELLFIDDKKGEELEVTEEVKSKCIELAKKELENFDKMTIAEWSKKIPEYEEYSDGYCILLKDFYGNGDVKAYEDIENEYNSMLKELNDKLYTKYKKKYGDN